MDTLPLNRGVESFTISTINFSIHGSNKRFFDKLYEGFRVESSIYVGLYVFLYLDNTDDLRLILKTIWVLKTISTLTTFSGFSLIYLMIFWIEYFICILYLITEINICM